MDTTLEQDIYGILSYEDSESIQSTLRREGINHILGHGGGAFGVPEGSLGTLYRILKRLLEKNGSATPIERVQIRCIGALGLIKGEHGKNTPPELSEMCNWLFAIAVSPTERIATTVSTRAGYTLESDRIIRSQ